VIVGKLDATTHAPATLRAIKTMLLDEIAIGNAHFWIVVILDKIAPFETP
jgi:hypothetical protein